MTLWIDPPTAFIKLGGRAAAEGARDFKGLVLRLNTEGIGRFCLDLTHCILMDSTFSGVLAGLAQSLGPESDHGCKRFTLVGANSRVHDLLDNLGVLELVNVIEARSDVSDSPYGQEVVSEPSSRQEVARCCLEAHRLLMALKPENEAKFREVAQVLEAQLN